MTALRCHPTFRFGGGLQVAQGTRGLRAAAGSGIKNPGFFELFGFVDGRFIGNGCLAAPKKSTGLGSGRGSGHWRGRAPIGHLGSKANWKVRYSPAFPAPAPFIATPDNRHHHQSAARGLEVSLAARIGAAMEP